MYDVWSNLIKFKYQWLVHAAPLGQVWPGDPKDSLIMFHLGCEDPFTAVDPVLLNQNMMNNCSP